MNRAAPNDLPATVIRERTYTNDEDRRAGFNRAENVRQIPPGAPDYQELYPQRNNAESANRRVDDHLYRERARSIGAHRQLLDLVARGLVVNAVARHLYGRQAGAPPQAA